MIRALLRYFRPPCNIPTAEALRPIWGHRAEAFRRYLVRCNRAHWRATGQPLNPDAWDWGLAYEDGIPADVAVAEMLSST